MKREEHEFGTLEIGNHYIIGEMNEGTNIEFDVVAKVIEVAKNNFHDAPWAYISNRINSYSLQPIIHTKAREKEKSMVAYAVVTNEKLGMVAAEIEKNFSDPGYQFKCFTEIESAVTWVNEVLRNN